MAKTYFKCKICGDIHYGSSPPDICPTCQNKKVYDPIDKANAKKEMGF